MALIDSLVSYWKMDEASGNALDAHGSNTLTDTNSVGTGAGVISTARDLEFDSNQCFTKADNSDLSTGDIDFEFAVWVKLESPRDTTAKVILSKWNDTGPDYEYWLAADYNQTAPTFYVSTSGGSLVNVAWGSRLSTGTWYLINAWHDSVNNQLGIAVNDGTPVTTSHSGGVRDGTAAFIIGNQNAGATGNQFDGLIDEVGFWKKVLSSAERTQLYNSGAGLAYPFSSGSTTYHNLGLLGVGG